MAYEGPLLDPDFPGFRDEDHILSAQCRRVLAEHLPPDAVDAIEVVCGDYFFWREVVDPKANVEALQRLSVATDRMLDAYDSLPPSALRQLMYELDQTVAGRWFGRRRSGYFAVMNRILRQPLRGVRAIGVLIDGLATAADRAANAIASGASPRGPGRPDSQDWEVALSISAVCLTAGVTPSERSAAFMEVMEAVWEACGRSVGPTHSIRSMRTVLKERTAKGEPYLMRLALFAPAFALSIDDRGRIRCELLSKQDYIAARFARHHKEIPE